MKFYIAENGKPAGPFEANELLAHGLTVNSQVWNETMDGWQSASNVPELMYILQSQQQMIQSQQPYQPEQTDQQPYQPEQPGQPSYQPPTGYGVTHNPDAQQQPYQPQQPQYQQPQYQQPQYQQQPYGQPYGPSQQQWAQPQYQQPTGTPPKDWKVESIILTILSILCCCNPLSLICGIIGIVNASKVSNAFYRGDHIGADEAAKSAKTWTIIGIVLMVIGGIVGAVTVLSSPDFLAGLEQGMESV